MRLMIFLALTAISGAAQAAAPITGRWITDDGKSIVVRETGGLNAKGCILFFCRAQQWTPAR